MSITNELREWARGFNDPWKANEQAINAIADRIDKAIASEYVRLPVDADGEVWHVGDVMEWPTTGETFEVVGIGDGTLFYVEDGNEYADWTGATTKRHHHEPTVVDVLREFAFQIGQSATDDGIVAEYAEKLREVVEHERD